jgi:copper chaperone CopZ
MTCCTPATPLVTADAFRPSAPWVEELRLASRRVGDGMLQTEISVPSIHCGGCINKIERGLAKLDGVRYVRVNLSSKRLYCASRNLDPLPTQLARSSNSVLMDTSSIPQRPQSQGAIFQG